MPNFMHSFLKGFSTGAGVVAAVGLVAVVLAIGTGVTLATHGSSESTAKSCTVVGVTGFATADALQGFLGFPGSQALTQAANEITSGVWRSTHDRRNIQRVCCRIYDQLSLV